MATAEQRLRREDAGRLLATAAAQVLLVCASLVICFAYAALPLFVASGAALALLLGGSFLCWRSFTAARLILLASLVAIELPIVGAEPSFLAPCAALDIAVAFILMRLGCKR